MASNANATCRHRRMTRAVGLAPLLCALAIAACGLGDDKVARYCEYGAVSDAQVNGCKDHVGGDQVDRLHTNAARYAHRDLKRCLADAGPFCRD